MQLGPKASWIVAVLLVSGAACSGDKKNGDDPGGLRDGGAAGDEGDGSGGVGSGTAGSGGRSGSGTAGDGNGGDGAPDGGAGVTDPETPTGIIDGGWMIPDELLLCSGGPCACADGIDNDGDGVADGFDIECTGPRDNDEGSFATGISGDNRDPFWQDCFFDGNSGAGDDKCRYHTECLTGERDEDDPSCVVTQQCIDFCKPLTPNGCDCFGCCTTTLDNGEEFSFVISADCDADNLEACQTCTPSDQCENECGECELCPGKSADDLPDHCFPPPTGGTGGSGGASGSGAGGSGAGGAGGTGGTGGDDPPYTCDNGMPTCTGTDQCPAGYYCFWGCCTVLAPD